MLTLQNISYIHPNKDLLFENLNLTVNSQEKIALVGNNGVGKSTLLKIIAQELTPSAGQLSADATIYYVPQIFGQFNHLSVAQALKAEDKLNAFHQILKGNATEENFALLNDDWTIEDRSNEALRHWQLEDIDFSQPLKTLSGGQKTKVFLAGIDIHQPELVLLDEPSNHLDGATRETLYQFIKETKSTLIVVSHDRTLLNLLNTTCELSKRGVTVYGGNYSFYQEQQQLANNALIHDIQSREKALRNAKEKERETQERQQKQDARGKKKQEKAGVARIMMNTLRNNAENSTSKLKNVHAEKIEGISQELRELRTNIPDVDKMRFGFKHAALHKGKILVTANNLNYKYGDTLLWKENLSFQISNGERIALKGKNGAGKTTLIKLIQGELTAQKGMLSTSIFKSIYIDQDYSLLTDDLKVYEQAQFYNSGILQEHEIKIRLNRFLFSKTDWDKPCSALSGGERMRLMLCCLTIASEAPDMIILDEPTNNLDIQNIEILTAAINEYQGTLLVIAHDDYFLAQTNIEREIHVI